MKVLIYRGDDDKWVAECPSLPGCISQGTTRTEAIDNIREAIELYLEDLKESGENEPQEFDGELVEISASSHPSPAANVQEHLSNWDGFLNVRKGVT